MAGALNGIVVLEVASYVSGPYATMLLADLGAEVIKVENPAGGDPFRSWHYGGATSMFWAYNRGKKSIALDLRQPAGVQVFERLARGADVVVENLRAGVMDRLGLGYERLARDNPRLVYCSITGFGADGPAAQRPAYDSVGQALSGLLSLLTERDDPRFVGPPFADSLASLYAAQGVLAALVARGQTGRGQRVGATLVGSTLAFVNHAATDALAGAPLHGPRTRPRASNAHAWTASDGLPFVVHLSSPAKFWEGLVRAADRPDLAADPRFSSHAARQQHYEALRTELAAVFATRPRAYWLARLEAEGVPYAPLYDTSEVFDDPQIQHLGLQIAIPRPGQPPIRTVGCPLAFSDTPPPFPPPPPELGEHTDALLARAGYTAAEIAALRAQRTVQTIG